MRLAPDSKQKDSVPTSKHNDSGNAHKAARANPRKGRLIIRNLSFKATEESMRQGGRKLGLLNSYNP